MSFDQIETAVKQDERQKNEAEGALKQLISQLDKEFGLKTPQQVKAEMEKLDKEFRALTIQQNKEEQSLKTNHPELFQ